MGCWRFRRNLPGLYGFTDLRDILDDVTGVKTTLEVNLVNGIITLTIGQGGIVLSDGLLSLLGLDDGLGGQRLDTGTYNGDRPVNFTNMKELYIHFEQINSTSNVVDGAPSSLLTTVGLGRHQFGDIVTDRVNHPEFKRLRDGVLDELKITV